MTKCEPCALRDTGRSAEAEDIEALRSQKLLLAHLKGNLTSEIDIARELMDCRDCIGRLAMYYMFQAGAQLMAIHGSQERAADKVAESVDTWGN